MKPLPAGFFARPTDAVAEALVGKLLVRQTGSGTLCERIVETEAYLGPEDGASHARFGNKGRARVMFGPAGVWYVYLIYGMHAMLNVVTEKEGVAGAVLIRATEHYNGPGRLTKALGITTAYNKIPMHPPSDLWIADAPTPTAIVRVPRVGIAYAPRVWRDAPLRFVLSSSYGDGSKNTRRAR